MRELDKIFSDFERRKQREKEAQDKKDAKHKAFRIVAVKIINEKVAPLLKEISAHIKDHGHEAKVSLLIDGYSYPRVSMSFQVVCEDLQCHTGISKISFFTATSEDRMEVNGEIWGKSGKSKCSSSDGQCFKLLSEVTPEWVKKQVLYFVGAVLNNQ